MTPSGTPVPSRRNPHAVVENVLGRARKLSSDSLARQSSLGQNRVTVYSFPTVTTLA
jgi:hypothetical protein